MRQEWDCADAICAACCQDESHAQFGEDWRTNKQQCLLDITNQSKSSCDSLMPAAPGLASDQITHATASSLPFPQTSAETLPASTLTLLQPIQSGCDPHRDEDVTVLDCEIHA
jgi:hypothetical protein